MCTSFVVHSDNTIIGMNFDISKRPIKIVLLGNQLLFLQYENGQFLPAFGFNSNGTFMNLLMVEPNEEGKYRRGKNCVHIMKLFADILEERIELPLLKDFLEDKTLVNVPNYSVHSMIAGKNRNTYIVEPGRKNLDINLYDRDFMILTNFPLSEYIDQEFPDVMGSGKDRYMKAHEMILKNKGNINKDVGFSILKETVQHEGDYPTQVSIISLPEESAVYFALNADFGRIYQFSFLDNQIRTNKGFENEMSYTLTKKGILLSELENW